MAVGGQRRSCTACVCRFKAKARHALRGTLAATRVRRRGGLAVGVCVRKHHAAARARARPRARKGKGLGLCP